MSPPKTAIKLRRFIDGIPIEASDEDAADFLSQQMRKHEFKVYVRKPDGTSVFENGFPHRGPLFMHPLQAMPFPTSRIKEEIAEAKRQGPVIDYAINEPEIRFLELDSGHVSEIASKKLTKVHWFDRGALRAEKYAPVTAAEGLIPAAPRLRCLRPSNDTEEMMARLEFGGAIKGDDKYRYEFRVHDIFVQESDLGVLKFNTYKPSKRRDPFGLYDSALAVYFAYRAAKDFRISLKNGTKTKEDVIQWLKQQSPKSPYRIRYVADQIFKYINPDYRRGRGIGGEVPPFNTEAIESFKNQYPNENDLSDGLILIMLASFWWSRERDRHSRGERVALSPTKEIHLKLQYYGFFGHDETQALFAVITWRGNSKEKRKIKAKSAAST